MTTIELNDKEAAQFLEFRKNQSFWSTLIEQGLFSMRNGSITIHYGPNGQASVETKHLTKL